MNDQTKTHFWTGLPISDVPHLIDRDDDDVRNDTGDQNVK